MRETHLQTHASVSGDIEESILYLYIHIWIQIYASLCREEKNDPEAKSDLSSCVKLLLMEEMKHQLICKISTIEWISYLSAGAGFLPSTVRIV